MLRPYYPASDLFRVVRDDDGLQLDFMGSIHGVRSFAGLRARATGVDLGGSTLLVASLPDIIRSKKAARRPRDLAVLEVLEKTDEEKRRPAPNARRPPLRKRPRAKGRHDRIPTRPARACSEPPFRRGPPDVIPQPGARFSVIYHNDSLAPTASRQER